MQILEEPFPSCLAFPPCCAESRADAGSRLADSVGHQHLHPLCVSSSDGKRRDINSEYVETAFGQTNGIRAGWPPIRFSRAPSLTERGALALPIAVATRLTRTLAGELRRARILFN
jgi:hypothetical protein